MSDPRTALAEQVLRATQERVNRATQGQLDGPHDGALHNAFAEGYQQLRREEEKAPPLTDLAAALIRCQLAIEQDHRTHHPHEAGDWNEIDCPGCGAWAAARAALRSRTETSQ